MRPAEALEQQIALIKWWKTETGRRFGEAFTTSEANKTGALKNLEGTDGLARFEALALDRATTFFVEPEMVSLAEAASRSMPPQGLKYEDLVVPHGFVWLDRPIYTVDVHRKRLGVRAIHWAPHGSASKA